MLLLEDHIRSYSCQNARDQGTARDHKITHAGPTITHVPATKRGLKNLQTPPSCGRLGERDAGSDVVTEPVSRLTDELEVDTSIPIQKPCDVRCAARFHFFCWPSLGIALKAQFGCDNEGSTDMIR